MNSDAEKDSLEQILVNWSEAHEPQQPDLLALQQRIINALQRNAESSDADSANRSVHELLSTKRGRYGAVIITAAAMLLVALTLRFQLRPTPMRSSETIAEASAWQSPESLKKHAALFQELQQLFDQRIRCVAESDQTLTFELVEEGELPDPESWRPLSIRIVLQRRVPGERDWTPVSHVNVVSKPEQVCRLTLGPSQLRLWAFRLPDGMILVESEFPLTDGMGPRMAASQLLPEGEAREVLSVVSDGVEYRVMESAVWLEG
ncbi:hypothetical protein SH661x_002714 [Planctomicrobium sp. SH661]|uniref:hypothetical protein n=1 Tax=Planctomicrobium sp. SH661 TaxID=3448124 RepID=UPI003F5B9D26